MVTIIKDEEFVEIADLVKPDAKKRVVLPRAVVKEGAIYHIYANSVGQIVLDPQVVIPASEAWLFENPDAIATVRRGLADAKQGKISKVDLNTL